MKFFQNLIIDLPRLLLSSIASVLTVAQIILAFVLHGHPSVTMQWIGWICIWTSGILGILPIITFRKIGGVPEGESYMKTTTLVDTGIYAIVRHPQGGTAWLLINFGTILIAWHWTSTLLGLVSMGLAYLDSYKADHYLIEKFGDAYKRYIKKVPRINIIAGIIRLALRTSRESEE